MKIEVRAGNAVHIEGYVNAVERDSHIITVPSIGQCVEQIRAGVFDKALRAASDVMMLENHDETRKLGSISEGNLKLYEDNIGLRAIADIVDADIADKARRKMLKGWSFGFICTDSEIEQRAGNVPRRIVKGMMLSEVSLIDGAYKPCYNGTLVEVRSEGDIIEYRGGIDETVEVNTPTDNSDTPTENSNSTTENSNSTTVDETVETRSEEPDYSYYDAMLRYHELRYNPYHDDKGRFCSGGGGGGGGVLVVPKGQKGKGFYVGASDRDFAEQALATEYEEWKKVRQNAQGGQTAEESERIKNELVDSVNPKFVGLKREAVNGEKHWAWTKGRALSENEAQEMEINKVYDKGKYSVVSGGIGNEIVYFAADSSNPTIAKAKAIVAERKVKSMERFERDRKKGLETLYDRHTTGTTTTYDRWRSNNLKKFDEYWNGAQGNSRAEVDDDSADPV